MRALFAAVLMIALPGLAMASEGAGVVSGAQAWLLVSAALVFVMQGGFLALEAGLVRSQGAPVTAMKNVVDWAVATLIWLVFGYGLAFGLTSGGWVGSGFLMGAGIEDSPGGWAYFLFQLGFVGAAVTIVSGAMAERVGFHTYVMCTVINAALLFPFVAHWVWGSSQHVQDTLLGGHGFLDFAGATVVHSLGGWIALVAVWAIGPRIGRFDADGKPLPMKPYSLPLAALGVILLWFGWWGFNGGSAVGSDSVGLILINTHLAGAAGCLVAWMHGRWQTPDRDVELKLIGGALAGLVAVTACANIVSPGSAIVIGVLAGLVHNLIYEWMLRARLDDAVGAVPVHLGGGVLGTLCVALFGKAELLPHTRWEQLGVQFLGVVVVGVFAVVVTTGLLLLLKRTIGLRVSPREEMLGASLNRLPPEAPRKEVLDEAALRRMMGGE
ncbi:MAG: ammonium transporter [Pseudomarimonas sp.]